MADLSGLNAEAKEHDLQNGPKPAGFYDMVLIEDELRTYPGKPTKQWFLKFQIIAGQFAGETHLDSVNLVTGAGELNKGGHKFVENLFNAAGHVGKIINTNPIIGKPFTAKLDLKDSDKINEKTGKPYKNNVMAGHYRLGMAPKTTAPQEQTPQPAAGSSAPVEKRPWG